jgi:hypothetical protein
LGASEYVGYNSGRCKNNEEVKTFLRIAERQLEVLGYTEHSSGM